MNHGDDSSKNQKGNMVNILSMKRHDFNINHCDY